MPTINTVVSGLLSGSEAASITTSPKSPFPYSPDSYCLPKSITKPSNPESPLLPTNSPTFLVSGSSSEGKPVFKVPTSPLAPTTGREINAYIEWMDKQGEDENEGLIMFPTYDTSAPLPSTMDQEDLEILAEDESTEDSYSEDSISETESSSNTSSRSSSPSLEGEEFDDCDTALCETWSTPSTCSTPPPTAPPFIFAEDDIALHNSSQPTRCVDYLAHEWKTEDIWGSFKHIRSHRDSIRASKRLENALWRVWWRDSRGLERVDPEVIHWLKDSDITWLYGPFKPAFSSTRQSRPTTTSPTKSLLKKPHPAKAMQQRSEYTFSLLREATGYASPSLSSSPVPSPSPKHQQYTQISDVDAIGGKLREKKRRVVFNEVVVLYREVVEEPEYTQEYLDELEERWEHFRDFDESFGGVD